jgi:hypothetical protein
MIAGDPDHFGEARPQVLKCLGEMSLGLADVTRKDQPIVRRCPNAGKDSPGSPDDRDADR